LTLNTGPVEDVNRGHRAGWSFAEAYGASGRVNLLGMHTGYNYGYVPPHQHVCLAEFIETIKNRFSRAAAKEAQVYLVRLAPFHRLEHVALFLTRFQEEKA